MSRRPRARLALAAALAPALLTVPGLGTSTAFGAEEHAQAGRAGGAAAAVTGATVRRAAARIDCAKVKCLALTFDDGPGKYAGRLLDTLKKHKAKATFFLEGQYVKSRKAYARRMAKEGHELGNHSYTHPHLTQLDDDGIRGELTATQEMVHKVTGKWPELLRPPYGEYDERVQEIGAELGMPLVMWNTPSHDWYTHSGKAIYKEVLAGARPGGIVLMHDWVEQTVTVMPKLVTALQKRGYKLVTVSTLLGRDLAAGQVYPEGAVSKE